MPRAYSYLRMSTAPQLKGDSRRRQLEASRTYAAANGLELAGDAELEDIGVSAFKGDNVRDGALGQFLDAVRLGTVASGSFLIVESLDRLSRQEVRFAQSLFLSIIQAGINVVTLMDGKVYRPETVDVGDLILSLVIMNRAHEESATKSRRIAAAWQNKRTLASQKPMTKWCPAWLKLADDRKSYEEIASRVEVVRQIFRDTADGLGMYSIAARLNRANAETFGGPNGWHQSYIAKILANRAVLGESQPHVRRDGKRVPHGDPVQDYYPAIVDEELFYRAQVAKAERRVNGAGRKGHGFSNLFSGLARCAYCNGPILFENKGSAPKGGNYLICDSAKRHIGCPSVRWRYRDFEVSFLRFVEELDLTSVIDGSSTSQRKLIEDEISSLQGEAASLSDLMEKTYRLLTEDASLPFVKGKLSELAARRNDLAVAIERKSKARDEAASSSEQRNKSTAEIKDLIRQIQAAGDKDQYALRARVSSHLKALIADLKVGSVGYKGGKIIDPAEDRQAFYIDRYMSDGGVRDRRYFAITFRNHRVRIVFPDDADPFEYKQMIQIAHAGDPNYRTPEQIEVEQAEMVEQLRSTGIISP
ncbi:DNA invertase Pin-like site-specific DNA recombinase [Bradyrhizobium sp. RT6a]|uniref:recombinase family protein n=1 Tax=Bradyrhizobium sp. RT6a TaxID=3156381 RepID=UPI003396D369